MKNKRIFTKNFLKTIDIEKFIQDKFFELQGAAVFVKNDKSAVSRLISRCCKKQVKGFDFVPSHIASCFKGDDNKLYLLDVKPPKSTFQPLFDYLSKTKDDYLIILRCEKLDLEKYNDYMQKRINLLYGLFSAIQSVCKHITLKHGMHCSENYIYAYNQQGYYYDINANKSTPANLMSYLINKYCT